MHLFHCKPSRTVSIARWNVAGPFVTPNGILLNCNNPWGVTNAVLCLEPSDTGICQNPLVKSITVKYLAPDKLSKTSSMRGSGYLSFTVTSFKLLKSMHILIFPVFLVTRTAFDRHWLNDFSSTPKLINRGISSARNYFSLGLFL